MSSTRLLDALRGLLPALLPREPYLGPRKYRVVRMVASVSSAELTRVELQIVRAASGLPDLLIVPLWPGIAGARSELTPGTHVLVTFIDGDPQQPFVTHYADADDPAWKPVSTVLDATTSLTLGSGTPPFVARVDDPVRAGSLALIPAPPPAPAGTQQLVHLDETTGAPAPICVFTPAVAVTPGAGPVAIAGKILSGASKVRAQ